MKDLDQSVRNFPMLKIICITLQIIYTLVYNIIVGGDGRMR